MVSDTISRPKLIKRPEAFSSKRQRLFVAQSPLMTESSLSKINWRRGIAEVTLILIGIILALLFDNWNEARKDRILEEQLFAALREDL